MIIIRKHRETPMLPAACLSSFLTALVVWPLSLFGTASATDMGYLVLFGTTRFGLGPLLLSAHILFSSWQPRSLPACATSVASSGRG